MTPCFRMLEVPLEVAARDRSAVEALMRSLLIRATRADVAARLGSGGVGDLLVGALADPPLPRCTLTVAVEVGAVEGWVSAARIDPRVARALVRLRNAGRLSITVLEPSMGTPTSLDDCAVFVDEDGCAVALRHDPAVGVMDLYVSWSDPRARIDRLRSRVVAAGDGELDGMVRVGPPPSLVGLIDPETPEAPDPGGRPEPKPTCPFGPPDGFVLRDYQRAAVQAWQALGGRGILAMATGAGKTVTALAAAADLCRETPDPIGLVVMTPYIHLVDQWADVLAAWGLRSVRCYESSAVWRSAAMERIDMGVALRQPVALVTTMATAATPAFRQVIGRLARRPTMLVADEVHHFGSAEGARLVSGPYRWRLGLSATPARRTDQSGTQRILELFGSIAYRYGIDDGIRDGVLCPYRYEPVLVELAQDELTAYRTVMDELERVVAGEGITDSRYMLLLRRRADALNDARGKVGALRQKIDEHGLDRAVIYCASRTQMGAASAVVREWGGIPAAFTAEESLPQREQVIRRLTLGQIPAAIAMYALDEGIDVPAIRQAHLLASSGNPAQFVQRRGRVLRTAPDKRSALLVDYVTIPRGDGPAETTLVRREMRRALDFGASSLNADEVTGTLAPIIDRFGIADELEDVSWD